MPDSPEGAEQPASSQRPWWRRPAVITAISTGLVAVLAGWVQTGGLSFFAALFESREPLVEVRIKKQPLDGGCSPYYLADVSPKDALDAVRKKLQKLPSDTSIAKRYAYAEQALIESGAKLGTDREGIELTVTGKDSNAVVLHELKPIIKMNKSDLGGGSVIELRDEDPEGCGAGIPQRYFQFNPDNPVATPVPDASGKVTPFPYMVNNEEPEVIVLHGNSSDGSTVIAWEAMLHWTGGDKSGDIKIDNKGEPFYAIGATVPTHYIDVQTLKLTPANF
ncbi:hypothetical protein [Nonomuraea sp. 10N515B]|uniref:hypothetical protein n=1 Tax=Nonomuraea sp. 10N515B TaxID=3457422 RepID=UPI003FCD5F09